MGRGGPRRAGGRRGGADASRRCSRSRAPGATPPPTTSRRPRSRACRRSAAGAPAEGSPDRSSRRTCAGARSSPRSAGPSSSIFDGSGAAIPPVAVDARILVVGPGQDATAYLNAYRVLISDLVLLVGGGDAAPIRELKDVPVIGVELRLRPVEPITGRRVAVFTAGPAPVDHLDADVVARVAEPRQPRDAARGARADRRRRLPDRDQGGGDRRRRRGGRRARGRGRVRRQRGRLARGRAGPRRAAARAGGVAAAAQPVAG